jgi:uncharacterized protein (DUF4415 family)
MGIIKSTERDGRKPPKDVIRRVKKIALETASHLEAYDPECPPSSPEALKEFAALRAAQRSAKKRPTVTLRITPDILEQYKSLGKGYTGIMADVLKYAIDHPAVLVAATK